jgi:prepilin-type N-terminal cleavage/methylation domain-containing protein
MEYTLKTMRRIRREESGFTLIELLIVILILGILAGIAIFASQPFRQTAADACATANQRIQIVADAAVDAGVSSAGMFEAAPGDCAGGSAGGGGSGVTATFVSGAAGGASVTGVGATAGELLVAITTHRTLADIDWPGTASEPEWQFQGIAGFKTADPNLTDRRAIAVFTRIADGTAADDFTPTWSSVASSINAVVQRYTVSATPSSFTFVATAGDGTFAGALILDGAAGGSGSSLMVAGATMRDGTSISWSGASNATLGTAGSMTSSLASATVSGAGPHSATATFTPAGLASGFVLIVR